MIEMSYQDGWNKILLRQSDGYLIDLVGRFNELEINTLSGIQVNYYLSDVELDEIQIKQAIISKLAGSIDAKYDKNDFSYSSWTSDTNYTETLSVGGHKLYNELQSEKNRFVRFEINYKPIDL